MIPVTRGVDFDVIVVGAGPAGGYAADRIARAGFSVAILEEHREIGEPVQCGGLVTPRVFDLVDAKETIVHTVRGAEIFSPSGRCITIDGGETEAVVVDRAMFDRIVVERALRSGAVSFLGTQAQGARRADGHVEVAVQRGEGPATMTCRILIGADGVRSSVAKWFRILRPRKILPGFEVDMVNVDSNPDFVQLFVGRTFAPGFFGWIIPADDTARVGLCVESGNAYAFLQRMLEVPWVRPFVKRAQPIVYIAGGIPLGFPRRSHAANVLIVGDAACQAKATSGGGIYTGMRCAGMAADTAIEALETGDLSERQMHKYHRAWTRSVGKELRKDLAIHQSFTRLTDDDLETIFGLLDNEVMLGLIRRRGDIDFPSKIGWALLREDPRLLKYAGKALRAMIAKTVRL